jgi:hypothetical protein
MRTSPLSTISAFVIAVPLTLAIGVCNAAAPCKSGFVWRDAADGDAVCVTPDERTTAKQQNANGPNNRQSGGGASGPNTCRQGYVWREAFGGDVVCVTPYERDQARQQNARSPQRTAN